MYECISGQLSKCTATYAVVMTGGVGYKIFMPIGKTAGLELGSPLCLYTSYVVRELSHALYGFFSEQERDLFDVLIDVSGIGPKIALSLLGNLSIHELCAAIKNREIAALCKVPGVGKKTAERLFMELADKVGPFFAPDCSQALPAFLQDGKGHLIRDAMSALINLGYNQITAQKAVKKTFEVLPEDADLTDIITHALKHL